jgi:hypothetical protein
LNTFDPYVDGDRCGPLHLSFDNNESGNPTGSWVEGRLCIGACALAPAPLLAAAGACPRSRKKSTAFMAT